MKDKDGREYAKLSQLKAGDPVEVDTGFACLYPGIHFVSQWQDGRLYLHCNDGQHFLDGQTDNGEDIIGIYAEWEGEK